MLSLAGERPAIVGEGPTPINDVNAYRSCFGFPGSPLKIHGTGIGSPPADRVAGLPAAR